MGGEGDDVAVRHWVGMHATGNEPGDVGGVEHEQGPNLVGDLPQRRRLDDARIGRGPCHDQLGPGLPGLIPEFIHVDALVATGQAVRHEVVQLAAGVDWRAVGEVPAVVEAQAQNGVSGLEQGLVDGHVGVSTRVGLHVGVVGPEQGLDPLAGQVLHLVDVHVSAVVPLAGVALGVLVGQHRAAGLQYGRRSKVLGGDQLQGRVLTFELEGDVAEELVVSGGGPGHGDHLMVGSGGRSLVGSGGQHRRRPLEPTNCATAPGGYRARRRAVTGRVTR